VIYSVTTRIPRSPATSTGDSLGQWRLVSVFYSGTMGSPRALDPTPVIFSVTRGFHRSLGTIIGVLPHIMAVVTWGEPYVTTTKDWSRTQHPSPPTIHPNCYTGSSECTPIYHLTHQNLEMIPGTTKMGRRPRKTPRNHLVPEKLPSHETFSSVTRLDRR
jgi:hypothetical protein